MCVCLIVSSHLSASNEMHFPGTSKCRYIMKVWALRYFLILIQVNIFYIVYGAYADCRQSHKIHWISLDNVFIRYTDIMYILLLCILLFVIPYKNYYIVFTVKDISS